MSCAWGNGDSADFVHDAGSLISARCRQLWQRLILHRSQRRLARLEDDFHYGSRSHALRRFLARQPTKRNQATSGLD